MKTREEKLQYCADCNALLPGPYGTPGVAMARTRPGVLLCSDCGTREAFATYVGPQPAADPNDEIPADL